MGSSMKLSDKNAPSAARQGKCTSDSLLLRGLEVHAAIAQYEAHIRQPGLGTNLRFLLDTKNISMFRQQFVQQGKMRLILGQVGIGVLRYFYDFLMGTPIDENVWSVVAFCSFMAVVESEGLLLPCIRACGGEQNPKCLEFVLRFSMPRAPVENVSDFGLYTVFKSAHGLAYPL